MSILNKIKQGVAKSGSSKGKILYFRPDSKARVRFLSEIEDGIEVKVHDSFERGINVICQSHVGKKCSYCDDEDLRHRESYVWPVWDYEAKEVKLFMGYANNFNALPALIAMYESYETIMDRDYVIRRTGSQMQTSYSVVPMDKVKFKNTKAKAYSEDKMIKIIDKAFPPEYDGEDDEDIEDEEDHDEEVENDYEDKKPRDLYMECIERGLKAKKKQKKQYYVDMLVEDDENNDDDDWDNDDEDDDDEW